MIKINQIIRSRRKTISLIVKNDGSLIVRAPLHLPQQKIEELVERKANWVRAKQDIAQSNQKAVTPKSYIDGEKFLFLGKTHPLLIINGAKEGLSLAPISSKLRPTLEQISTPNQEYFLLSSRKIDQAQSIFEKWYKIQAMKIISERAAWFAQKYAFSYDRIRISSAQTRWGSCSSRGTLSFSWRLIMAPVTIIDYVILHELVHTVERNHGKGFWDKVGVLMPEYKQKIKWLKSNGRSLSLNQDY